MSAWQTSIGSTADYLSLKNRSWGGAVLPDSLNKTRVIQRRLNILASALQSEHASVMQYSLWSKNRGYEKGKVHWLSRGKTVVEKRTHDSQWVRAASHPHSLQPFWESVIFTFSPPRSQIGNSWYRKVTSIKMVCDSASSEHSSELEQDASLKKSLEELIKCMLRVWCKEGQALTKLGIPTPGKYVNLRRSLKMSLFQDTENFNSAYIYVPLPCNLLFIENYFW